MTNGPDQAGLAGDEDGNAEGGEAKPGESEPVGRLCAVPAGSPQEAPATIHERHRLEQLIAVGSVREDTVKQLAALTLGERIVERLSARGLGELEQLLASAEWAEITDAELTTRAGADEQEHSGRDTLRRWLDGGAHDRRAASGVEPLDACGPLAGAPDRGASNSEDFEPEFGPRGRAARRPSRPPLLGGVGLK